MRNASLLLALLAGAAFVATPALADSTTTATDIIATDMNAAITTAADATVASTAQASDQSTAAPAAVPAAPSAFTITGTAGVWSQYRYRGISQSNNRPAFQGSITVAHASGFYLATWGSTATTSNSTVNIGGAEIDVYGGYTHAIGSTGFTFDGGLYGYIYPGAPASNYYEVYGSLTKTYGPFTAKGGLNWAPDQSVFDPVQGTHYNMYVYGELGFSLPTLPVSFHSHLGHSGGGFNYTKDYVDYSVGVTYKWKVLSFDLSWVDTNISRQDARLRPLFDQTGTPNPEETYRAAKGVLVGSVSASF